MTQESHTMNKRFFLQAGAAMVGGYALSRFMPWNKREAAIASSREEPLIHTTFEITKTEAEWKDLLTPQQYHVLRNQGTEWAGSSPLDKEYREGTYHCAGCNQALFTSETKFNSRTGWPSFYAPIENAVGTHKDYRHNMERTEVHCSRCGGHLGHVFLDGPKPTGKRYCINGVALNFIAS